MVRWADCSLNASVNHCFKFYKKQLEEEEYTDADDEEEEEEGRERSCRGELIDC